MSKSQEEKLFTYDVRNSRRKQSFKKEELKDYTPLLKGPAGYNIVLKKIPMQRSYDHSSPTLINEGHPLKTQRVRYLLPLRNEK